MILSDTNPVSEKILIEGFRKMPAWRKLELLSQMVDTCRLFALAGLRKRYPEASDGELKRRLASCFLERSLVMKAYGWDPDREGY